MSLTVILLAAPAVAKEVTVKGVGVAPITQGEDQARRVSRELAKRDAVERALGAEVLVESMPGEELRRITATAAGRLQFKVLHEGVEGKVYITEIEAAVTVPPELEAKYPKPVAEEKTGYQPLVQTFPHGEINWRDGHLIARGSAKKRGADPKSEAEARLAALLDAYGMALEMVVGINFDPEETAQERMKKAPAIEYRVKGLIRGAEVIREGVGENGAYEVTIKVPLRGLMGVQRAFTETMNLKGPEGPVRKNPEGYTGLIVDARGLKARPAMFLEIVDEDGVPVYTIEMLEPNALAQRGMAAYVVGEKEAGDGSKGAGLEPGRYLTVTALAVIPEPARASVQISVPGFLSPSIGFLSLPSLSLVRGLPLIYDRFSGLLAQGMMEMVMRQGQKPVEVSAQKTTGKTRSRVVVRNTDAQKVRQANNENSYLRQGRTVVITDSMIGGTEGKRWRREHTLPVR